MPDNNIEVSGENAPAPQVEAEIAVNPQYEAGILQSVAASNEAIVRTPEVDAEIKILEKDVRAKLGGASVERSTNAAESLEGRKFPFQGISERYNATLSAERAECQEYFTGTWDELMEKFKAQGIKVHIGKNGEIYILPAESDDVENDGIMPRHLAITEDMDEDLQNLIRRNQK